MVYKCKVCGGQTIIDSNNGIVICEYCGTKQALPLFTEDSERLLYESGNNYLLHNEYDKAENVFNQLLTIKPNAAELYWDLVLCKFGVTYVKDPQTGKYIPTCNRTHYTPIFSDKNYLKAVELSSGEKKALFEDDAKTIDNIQKGIIAVSKKEKPFDIFISYKETDANGNRTKDSIEAQKLYEKLTEAGYKVFFSRITLEDKVGTEYEPYIYAALYSSKVMLTVCSSKENIEAPWVKNEWSRFLSLRQNDTSKTLLPLYFDMEKDDLPDEFALLSTYDMKVDGFEDELLRGVKKLIPLPIKKAEKRKQITKLVLIAAAVFVLVVGVSTALIVPKITQHGAVAATEPEDPNEKAYLSAMTLFDSADYTAAADAFEKLNGYKDSDHMVQRCAIQPEYDDAMQLYYDGRYAEAFWAFEKLEDYEDSQEQKEKAKLSWRKSLSTVKSREGYSREVNNWYITPNGTLADSVTHKEQIKIGEHGKVISITNGPMLYEDGTSISTPTMTDNSMDDVIQVVPSFWELGRIALKPDGTVFVEDLNECQYDYVKQCFAQSAKWKDIVALSAYTESYGMADWRAVLVALDAKGNVYLCPQLGFNSPQADSFGYGSFLDYPDVFKNIKTIDITLNSIYGASFSEHYYINAVALTNDGALLTYIDGEVFTMDADNIVDVCIVNSDSTGESVAYTLSSDGKLCQAGSDNVILSDVAEINDDYAVTRSGTFYKLDGQSLDYKTVVYDEWLSRME